MTTNTSNEIINKNLEEKIINTSNKIIRERNINNNNLEDTTINTSNEINNN